MWLGDGEVDALQALFLKLKNQELPCIILNAFYLLFQHMDLAGVLPVNIDADLLQQKLWLEPNPDHQCALVIDGREDLHVDARSSLIYVLWDL